MMVEGGGGCGAVDLCPGHPDTEPSVCGCGRSDEAQIDSDGDTVPDCVDRCPGSDDLIDSVFMFRLPECPSNIPTVSEWGLVVLTLLLLVVAKVYFGRGHRASA